MRSTRNSSPLAPDSSTSAMRLRRCVHRALRVAFGRSSEKLRDRVEQLELTLADIDELLGETATIAVETAIAPEPPDEPSKPTRRPLPERCRATSSSTLPRARALNVVVRCARSVRT